MLSNAGLRGARLDLTQNKLYTLTSGTQQVLNELKEPVTLYFYFSREAAAKQSPLIMPYATRGPGVPRRDRGALGRQGSPASGRSPALLGR